MTDLRCKHQAAARRLSDRVPAWALISGALATNGDAYCSSMTWNATWVPYGWLRARRDTWPAAAPRSAYTKNRTFGARTFAIRALPKAIQSRRSIIVRTSNMSRLSRYATANANRACCNPAWIATDDMTFRFSGGSITLRALTRKSSNSPAHTHPRWSPAVLRTFNTHNKCTGVCRFVRGIPVGIGRRGADLWGFCGARRSPDLPGGPVPGHPGTELLHACDHSSSNPAWPGQPMRESWFRADSARELPSLNLPRSGAQITRSRVPPSAWWRTAWPGLASTVAGRPGPVSHAGRCCRSPGSMGTDRL